ncbi:MAG: protein-tyrosine-phosphatase [Bacteroidia bacterium]
MIESIKQYCDQLVAEFGTISTERKEILEKISKYIVSKLKENKESKLIYICTHNSRRSHFGQVWSKVAASYYGIDKIETFSGGVEVTAIHPNTLSAFERAGFKIIRLTEGDNPQNNVFFSEKEKPLKCFSKKFDDVSNPQKEFAAIMTCSEAESNCPFVSGAEIRISTTYEDPKEFDNTDLQDKMYDERSRQIALENLYVFSQVKSKNA